VKPLLDQELETNPEALRLFLQEHVILVLTEALYVAIEESGMSRREVAAKVGRSAGYLTRVLRGDINLTLRDAADLFGALGLEISVEAKRHRWVAEEMETTT